MSLLSQVVRYLATIYCHKGGGRRFLCQLKQAVPSPQKLWAIKHGYMWDEYREKVLGDGVGRFDQFKKVLCPLLDQCTTRCAEDQKNGARAWPLGSSDYEKSCYKFGEIQFCNLGGTPEGYAQKRREEYGKLMAGAKKTARKARAVTKEVETTEEPDEEAPNSVVSRQMSMF